MTKQVLIWLLFFETFFFGAITAQNALTPEMVVNMKMVTSAIISPDGKHAAYTLRVQRENAEQPGGAYSELWMMPTNERTPKLLIQKPLSISSPSFHNNSERIYFLTTNRTINQFQQVYSIPIDSGAMKLVTEFERGVLAYRVSPDGKYLALTATDAPSDKEMQAMRRGEDWTVLDKNYHYTRLYVMNLESKRTTLVTKTDVNVWDFRWTPNSTQLIIQASDKPTTDASYMEKKLYTCSMEGTIELLCATKGKLGSMAWSPSGKTLAYIGATSIDDPAAASIFIYTGGMPNPVDITEGYKGAVQSFHWIDDESIVFVANEYSSVVTEKISWRAKKIERLHADELIYSSLSFAADDQSFACVANHKSHPNELFLGSLADRAMKRVSFSNPVLENVQFGEQKSIRWKAKDGLEIEGVLILPNNYAKGTRYPLVLSIHGGPESNFQNGWTSYYSMWGQLLAARGIAVLLPNYRASTGRGDAFEKLDHKDLGGKEFQDVIDAIQHLDKQEIIDKKKVGIGGFSYGGYFAALGATRYSEHFAASVMGAGITNWISYIGTTDIPSENTQVHWNLSCYEYPQLCMERSALGNIKKAKTPLLILHGERDMRVPLFQGLELYIAFRASHIPVEMVTYPREAHGISEKAHVRDFLDRSLAWFEKYLR